MTYDDHPHRWADKITTQINAWISPIIMVVLGTLLLTQWNNIQAAIRSQASAQQQIMVQLATIQEQIREGQQSYSAITNQVSDLQTEQRDHEHRITILETANKDPSTGKQFRP